MSEERSAEPSTSPALSLPKIIIIGAGWSGLVVAKTYLQINPNINLTILDESTTIGGVWSKNRLYPGLVSNSSFGLYEYSDFSFKDAGISIEGKRGLSFEGSDPRNGKNYPRTSIPGEAVQGYLESYARRFGIYDKIEFGKKVIKITRKEGRDGWIIETSTNERIKCAKLIMASGLHSNPRQPSIPTDSFTGYSFHSKHLGGKYQEILEDTSVTNITVIGGCKSAIEACSLFISNGKFVNWVIRPSDQGVPIVICDYKLKPNLMELNNTRIFSIFSPSIFDREGFRYSFLHKDWGLGRWLVWLFWWIMSLYVKGLAGYWKSENGRKIEPKGNNFFFDPPYISVLARNHPFRDWIHDESKIKVHRLRPNTLKNREMHFEYGTIIPTDAAIWCIGWKNTTGTFEDEEAYDLGLPISLTAIRDTKEEFSWNNLSKEKEHQVQKLFPQLRQEARPYREPLTTPYRMYRQILSPKSFTRKDRTIAFSGAVSSSQTAIVSEIIALWVVTWLENLLPKPLPSEQSMMEEVSLVNGWMTRRYGGRGATDPEIIIEIQQYLDTLCRDLGLTVYRKNRGIFELFKEWFLPYRASDYNGIVEEFLNNNRIRNVNIK